MKSTDGRKTNHAAWTCTWGDDHRAEVVHAMDADSARRSCDGYADGYGDIAVKRSPQFDGLSGAELTRAQMADGWQMPCTDCEHELYGWGRYDGDDEIHAEPFVRPCGAVYCDRSCYLAHARRLGRYAGNRVGVMIDATERWPGIEIVHVIGSAYSGERPGGPVGQVRLRFPGGRYPATWGRGDRHVYVAQCDAAAWREYAASIPTKDAP